MQTTTIRVSPDLINKLKEVAKNDGRSLNNLINKALTDFAKIGNPQKKTYAHPSHKPFPVSEKKVTVSDEQKAANKEIISKINSVL